MSRPFEVNANVLSDGERKERISSWIGNNEWTNARCFRIKIWVDYALVHIPRLRVEDSTPTFT